MVRVRNTEKTARSRPANLLLLHKYSIAQLRVTQRNSCHSNTKGTIYLERLRSQNSADRDNHAGNAGNADGTHGFSYPGDEKACANLRCVACRVTRDACLCSNKWQIENPRATSPHSNEPLNSLYHRSQRAPRPRRCVRLRASRANSPWDRSARARAARWIRRGARQPARR